MDVVRLLTKRLARAVGDAAEVSARLPVRLSLRPDPQPDLAVVKPGSYRERDRVWRHREPSGREYTRLDEVVTLSAGDLAAP